MEVPGYRLYLAEKDPQVPVRQHLVDKDLQVPGSARIQVSHGGDGSSSTWKCQNTGIT